MDKMQFENGVLVTPAKVTINGVEYEIIPAVYGGKTPLSAENINKMQSNIEESSVIINPTEPETGEKVWLQSTGKNKFNKNDVVYGGLQADGSVIAMAQYFTSNYIPVIPNTTYYKRETRSARFKYYYKDKTPYSNSYEDLADAGSAKSFTVPNDVYYIRFTVFEDCLATLQVEEGPEATEYENFIKDKILIKNKNGNFTEFVNFNKIIEGVWVPKISTLEGVDPTVTYEWQYGKYKKIGSLVFISFRIRGKITALNGTNNYGIITGLPFASTTSIGQNPLTLGSLYGLLYNPNNSALFVLDDYIRIQNNYGSEAAGLKITETSYFEINGSGWYEI